VKRILIVDDNPLILQSLSDAFSGDYLVDVADSGEEGLTVLEQAASNGPVIDLIITDLNMPGIDGYELAHRVKEQNHLNRYIPVIMLTSMEITKEEARAHGCAAYIPKSDMKKVVSMTHILLPR